MSRYSVIKVQVGVPVDILLFAGMDKDLQAGRLYAAIQSVFEVCGTPIPTQLDQIPIGWRPKFNQYTKNLGLPFSQFDEAVQAAQSFIHPVLSGTCSGTWDPKSWKWKSS
ncbi:MAG: hypothetical protein ABIG63_07225 [Chloroflexota bacterium]